MNTAAVVLFLFSLAAFGQPAGDAEEIFGRALTDFQSGRFQQAADEFDMVAKLEPGLAPQLWQRGIALYYAGRYKDCRAQFELHRTVNPNDVENAAWHFLCVARQESPEKARAALLPVGPDPRVPMRQIYQMFRGEMTPEKMLASAGTEPQSQFYAHLYAGLYFEAIGNKKGAVEQITIAAEDRYSGFGYMYTVARLHRDLLRRGK